MLDQQFKTMAQQSVFEKISVWAREMYGELVFIAPDAPLIILEMGSTRVSAMVFPWGDHDATITVRSYVVTEVSVTPDLMYYLLQTNANVAFGAFGLEDVNNVVFDHTIIGSTCDKEELRTSFQAVTYVADEQDDIIVSKWGGKRAIDR